MKDYYVTISERRELRIEVEAESEEDAIEKVRDKWNMGMYTLGGEHQTAIRFDAERC